ncbi:rhodanese-like domain-containing protein [Lagierella sp.]|uniref:sulfurtransferase n=1 Tax=Lagierella sp. TaxID=2849657 RepID=UPI002619C977|nr:rhodanese-like domain-containing protein [Lagierella sp.]
MKKYLKVLLLALVVTLSVVACNKKPAEDTKTTEETTTEASETTEGSEEATEGEETAKISPVVEEKRVYVDAKWAKDFMEKTDKDKYVLAEVTWGEEKDSPDYLKKHIPGAIHINTDLVEEGPVWNFRKPEEIEKNFLDLGITSDKTLILYGPDTGADRVALGALYMGVKDVKIIDGRLMGWEKAGFETEEGSVKPTAATEFGVKTPAHPEYILSLDETVDKLKNDKNFTLVSVRSKDEWLGKTSGYSYIPKAGEPKGALWGESGEGNSGMENYWNEDLTVKNFEDVVAQWKTNGIGLSNDMSFYCGTGWRAATPFLMMYERGYDVTLFDGGWNEWQMHDDLDVQVGDPGSSDVKYEKVKDLSDDKAAE